VFGFGGAPPTAGAGVASVLDAYTGVVAEGGFLALTILWILWPALAVHRLQTVSGAIDTLRHGLSRLTARPALQALLVGWLFALFFEGAAWLRHPGCADGAHPRRPGHRAHAGRGAGRCWAMPLVSRSVPSARQWWCRQR
jgi:hypothetical protein